jgi:hypothetical protein
MTQKTTDLPTWTQSDSAVRLGLVTFGILVLELAIIRWIGSQIRVFAYFSNLVLIAAFLGMGLGVALGRKYPRLFDYCFPALLAFSILLAFSERFGLINLSFPDISISLWGAESFNTSLSGFLLSTAIVLGVFWFIVFIFLCASIPVGWWFESLPPLRAYSYDLFGSLLGVISITVAAAFFAPPSVWFALGILPLALVNRRWIALLGIGVVVFAGISGRGASFSPYNRIDITNMDYSDITFNPDHARPEWNLSANRDYHQYLLDLSQSAIEGTPPESNRRFCKAVYELPFRIRPQRGRALIVGAGTGNDVAAALRCGFEQVVCVEIDPIILKIGRERHPERPYDNPRVKPVNNDARAYFEQNQKDRFDVVCYGLVDSHAMFSAMSTLRLDNYLYTVEGIRSGWRHVTPDGVLTLSFSTFAGPWIQQRLANILIEATGQTPVIIPHGYNFGVTFLVGRSITPALAKSIYSAPLTDIVADAQIRTPSDDWPFLYLRPGAVPYAYLAVLGIILLTAFFAVRKAFGGEIYSSKRFNIPLFLMGVAFMLLETRMVTELSLLFGSTWIVNSSVFAGILIMVLLANTLVSYKKPTTVKGWFAPLVVSLVIIWVFGSGFLNQFSIVPRGILGGLLFALPVFFAGVIVSTLLKESRDISGGLGSNLLGSVLGGCLEYLSMYAGLRKMTLLVIAVYLMAYLVLARRNSKPKDETQTLAEA